MEDELKMLLKRLLFSFEQKVVTECARICRQYDLSPKSMVNSIIHYYKQNLQLKSQFLEEDDDGTRSLTVPILNEIISNTFSYAPDQNKEIESTVVLPKRLDFRNTPHSTNKEVCHKLSLKIMKKISYSNSVSPEPALNTLWFKPSEMCIGGRVLEKKGIWGNDSFVLKTHASSTEEREIEIVTSDLTSYRLFMGQTIIVKGRFLGVSFFRAKEIYTQLHNSPPPVIRPQVHISDTKLFVAVGPFVLNNLIYEHKFFKFIKNLFSGYVILFGPFIEDTMTLEVFVNHLILSFDGEAKTLILVPSLEDDKAFPVFPQRPLTLKETSPNVILLPNPFFFKLADVVIGGCSTDVLSQLKRRELLKCEAPMNDDNETDLILHIFNNKSFYPLYPPEEIHVDYEILSEFEQFTESPHILFLCSKLKPFATEVRPSCHVLNPGNYAQHCAEVLINNKIFCKILDFDAA